MQITQVGSDTVDDPMEMLRLVWSGGLIPGLQIAAVGRCVVVVAIVVGLDRLQPLLFEYGLDGAEVAV